MAKQPKSMGFFDNLPDNVLCHILSFLPTKDTARTSVLSPRWRYLFVSSISELDFKPCITTLQRGVKKIVIFSVKKKNPPLPTTLLFSCQSLVTLKVKIRGVNGVPSNAYFGMPHANCRRGFNVIKIDAPNLVYFKYANGMAEECTLSEMKSLERADIQITEMDNDDRECVANLLRGVCNVQSLYLGIEDSPRKARKSGGFESLPAIVPSCLLFRIKEIEIKYFDGKENMFGMVSYFLKHASVMEKLIIRRIDVCEEQPSTIIEKLLSLPKESKKCEIMTP
ncbi:putative F-box protein At3g58950 [Hibiscus syriacus]|uniref:putative F-box protein At3g58950 n=1 Tax=Hibiscus syriacus TaxID=106335 RepID=UPI0019232C37|nr:putative F-box protein At3g58950 [Hibiscus syriacus]